MTTTTTTTPTQQKKSSKHKHNSLYVLSVIYPNESNDIPFNDAKLDLPRKFINTMDLSGLPTTREHDPEVIVGKILATPIGPNGTKYMISKIHTDTIAGRLAADEIKNGELNETSITHKYMRMGNTEVIVPIEVAYTKKGARQKCNILDFYEVAADDEKHPVITNDGDTTMTMMNGDQNINYSFSFEKKNNNIFERNNTFQETKTKKNNYIQTLGFPSLSLSQVPKKQQQHLSFDTIKKIYSMSSALTSNNTTTTPTPGNAPPTVSTPTPLNNNNSSSVANPSSSVSAPQVPAPTNQQQQSQVVDSKESIEQRENQIIQELFQIRKLKETQGKMPDLTSADALSDEKLDKMEHQQLKALVKVMDQQLSSAAPYVKSYTETVDKNLQNVKARMVGLAKTAGNNDNQIKDLEELFEKNNEGKTLAQLERENKLISQIVSFSEASLAKHLSTTQSTPEPVENKPTPSQQQQTPHHSPQQQMFSSPAAKNDLKQLITNRYDMGYRHLSSPSSSYRQSDENSSNKRFAATNQSAPNTPVPAPAPQQQAAPVAPQHQTMIPNVPNELAARYASRFGFTITPTSVSPLKQ